MGKGFQNFMSKKDFHPSAFWNLKKVWEAREKVKLEKKREEEMRAQYEKEQEMVENKALLGDEKARIGLSFMYDAPAGIKSRDEEQKVPELEPKFEWQRKYNAPREEWAKGNEEIKDQPFGIQVRNVRCVKCHNWGHINTDNECPLYNMSGNYDHPGFSTNPSDLIKGQVEARRSRKLGPSALPAKEEKGEARMDPDSLEMDMKEEYGLKLKKHVMDRVHADDAVESLGRRRRTTSSSSEDKGDQQQLMFQFLQTLSETERAKIFNDFFKSTSGKKKHKKHKIKKEKKQKKRKRHDSSSESEDERPSRPIKSERPPSRPIKREHSPRPISARYNASRPIKKEPVSPRPMRRERSRSPRPMSSRHSPPRPMSSRHSPPRPMSSRHSPPRPMSSRHSPPRPMSSRHSPPRPIKRERSPVPSKSRRRDSYSPRMDRSVERDKYKRRSRSRDRRR